jgi:thiol:disulfide interchange protein DsbD
MKRRRFSLIRQAAASLALALALVQVHADEEFLAARQAYRFEAASDGTTLTVRYEIAPGYYLYRDRLGFASETPGVTVGAPALPAGEDHEDEYFGHQVIYRGAIDIPVRLDFDGPPKDFDLLLKLQGCADGGLCYPPQTWTTTVHPTAAAAGKATPKREGFSLRNLLGGRPETDGGFLPVDEAFVLSADSPSPDRVTLRWGIADDYYLYRDKIKVTSPTAGVKLGKPAVPGGKSVHDDYFGEQVVFYREMVANVPVSSSIDAQQVDLEVSYQGCASEGLCYPPTTRRVQVSLAPVGTARAAAPDEIEAAPPVSEQDALAQKIRSGNLFAVLATFFGAGLLLAFTPCVLPMVPILSGIIVGAGGGQPVSRGRAFALSVAYVLGMAITYTVAGAVFAAAGQQAQAFFQKPWIIAAFAALFVWLALGMFGLFNLQVPAAFQAKVARISNQQKQGTLIGTAIMGAFSSLIVTACVAPPLVAALAVIGQSGDVFRGGAALFALSIGMGAPLLLVGASAGNLLPKAGAWMDSVKAVFGVMLLGVAVWMLGRILPGPATLSLWAALAFISGYCLLTMGRPGSGTGIDAARRGLGALALVYGVLMLVGALAGRSDPLQPLAGIAGAGDGTSTQHAEFRRIKSVEDLDRELLSAQTAGLPVMLDFYADWCVSCLEMERFTFTDPAVMEELQRAVLLQADVTANDAADQALLKRFGILGPPTIVFFGKDGMERTNYRIVGFKPADEFRQHASQAFADNPA